jgi:hypothetical protein
MVARAGHYLQVMKRAGESSHTTNKKSIGVTKLPDVRIEAAANNSKKQAHETDAHIPT